MTVRTRRARRTLGALLFVVTVTCLLVWRSHASADQLAPSAPQAAVTRAPQTAQPRARNPLKNAYFGDLHVHTAWSLDAYVLGGNTVNGPDVAYRFGRGEAISGEKLRMPLDFMAVTDHDSYLGDEATCLDPSEKTYNVKTCQDIRGGKVADFVGTINQYYTAQVRHPPDVCPGDQSKCIQKAAQRWHQIQKNADQFYEPGKFTTFPAYEWTGMGDAMVGAWFHRNVIFNGKAVPEWGGSAIEMKHHPERLWAWLDRACTGECQVIAIPHNTNYGLGQMLAMKNSDGTPFTKEILVQRAKAESLIEIHQQKGNSECQLGIGTADEDCNFEIAFEPCKPGMEGRCAYATDFARNALKNGLITEEKYGVNAFKLGFISSTDTHRSAPGQTDEDVNASGQGRLGDKPKLPAPLPGGQRPPLGSGQNPGGLAGVWAEENTRDAIFDGLKRRETFGTSGTRVRVRMFGGWNYPPELHMSRQNIAEAYRDGVPMGSDLPVRPASAKAPRFMVWATKDPNSANLQRIQIVKGWTAGGQAFEKTYDVVCSDGIKPNPKTNRCADNGAKASLTDCSLTPNKGAAELSTTWTDPDFSPTHRAFYYAKVIENPVCRGTTRLALRLGVPPPKGDPPIIQERAWGSPIWYSPH
jgi:hypothetical protein